MERVLISRLNIEDPPREMLVSGSRFGKVPWCGCAMLARLRFGGGAWDTGTVGAQGLVSIGFNARYW